MSHSKERHEKICLNCNAELHGRYCHVCGQENIEPKETVWTLVSHFFYDITHFDGKFFSTTRYLIIRPGLLPKEYIAGRRARYLHPIRMYVFSSALFFIIFYSLFNSFLHKKEEKERLKDGERSAKITLDSARIKALAGAKSGVDSTIIENAFGIAVQPYIEKLDKDTADTKEEKEQEEGQVKSNINIIDENEKFTSVDQYDSFQHTLPVAKRDGWLKRLSRHRNIEIHERYKNHRGEMAKDLMEKFMHTFPYLLFVSLPLFALYLTLLYWRRKQFLYVTHGIFLIYLYIFTFIDLLAYFGLNEIHQSMHWNWLGWIEAVVLLYGIYYAFRAMHKFYGQGIGKTLLKFILLNVISLVSIICLFLAFFLFTVFKF